MGTALFSAEVILSLERAPGLSPPAASAMAIGLAAGPKKISKCSPVELLRPDAGTRRNFTGKATQYERALLCNHVELLPSSLSSGNCEFGCLGVIGQKNWWKGRRFISHHIFDSHSRIYCIVDSRGDTLSIVEVFTCLSLRTCCREH